MHRASEFSVWAEGAKQRAKELGPWAAAAFVVAPLLYLVVHAWVHR